jgi:hypothetical protein
MLWFNLIKPLKTCYSKTSENLRFKTQHYLKGRTLKKQIKSHPRNALTGDFMANDIEEIRECVLTVVDAKTAEKIVNAIVERFKGGSAYFKKGRRKTPINQNRDKEIQFMHKNGKNVREISRKFDLSDRRIGQIIESSPH